MGKPKAPPKQAENEARAVLRMLRISPQKLNLIWLSNLSAVCQLQQRVELRLKFSRKRHSEDVRTSF